MSQGPNPSGRGDNVGRSSLQLLDLIENFVQNLARLPIHVQAFALA
jgi:hypothetical protein